jgi:hypothetical protein
MFYIRTCSLRLLCFTPVEFFLVFAQDKYILRFSTALASACVEIKKLLEIISKWLKESGLKGNKEKNRNLHLSQARSFTLADQVQ